MPRDKGMKRLLIFLLCLTLFLPSCTASQKTVSPAVISKNVKENASLFLSCYDVLSDLKRERVYAAMEEEKDENGKEISGTKRLVLYEKESGEREEFESPVLEETLEKFDLALIFFQTASDGRICVIFSYSKEADTKGIQNGFYYSPDTLPCAWWGRKGDLIRKDDRYLQLNRNEDAAYYTVHIDGGFYYFEKYGDLLA